VTKNEVFIQIDRIHRKQHKFFITNDISGVASISTKIYL